MGAAGSGVGGGGGDPPQEDLGRRVQDLEPAGPRRQALRLPLGGWSLFQRSSGRGPAMLAGVDGSYSRRKEGVDCGSGRPPRVGAIVAGFAFGLQSSRDESGSAAG